MVFVIGKACPGLKNRTGALLAAGVACLEAVALTIAALLGMIYANRQDTTKAGRRTNAETEMVTCYYGAGFALWGCYMLFNTLLIAGILTENKRALGMWMCFVLLIPLYFVGGLIFLLASSLMGAWEIAYIVTQVVCLLGLIWITLAIWVFFSEVRNRDKNPELRVDDYIKRKENEIMLTNPMGMMMLPSGSHNPGYGAPGGGSLSSIPRSHRSRHTYAPTEADSVRTAPSVPRQSRLDQYRAQQAEKTSINPDKGPEREGGTTYYRYEYNAAATPHQPSHPQYPPSQPHPPQPYPSAQPRQPYQGSQGSLNGAMGSRRNGGSQGSLTGVGVRGQYQPAARVNQPAVQLGGSQSQIHKDSEV